jgi:hypothetical protein
MQHSTAAAAAATICEYRSRNAILAQLKNVHVELVLQLS